MKYFFFMISFLIFLTTHNVRCQEWKQVDAQFDPPSQYHLSNGIFFNENIGWLSTSYPGRIYHTTDGGKSFFAQFDSTFDVIHDINFINPSIGWAIAEETLDDIAYLLRTNDGGLNWDVHELDTIYYELKFFDELSGLAAANDRIFYTDDGGSTWKESTLPDTIRFNPHKFFFINNRLGWSVGDDGYLTDSGMILKTYDGGRTWHTSLYEVPPMFGIAFYDSLHGCAVGWGAYYTEDGGTTWHYSNSPIAGGNDVAFSDDSTAWSASKGSIKMTNDLGANWVNIPNIPDVNLSEICFVDSGKIGYALGSSSTLLKYEADPVKVLDGIKINKADYHLYQNYPNPFNPKTVICYYLPSSDKVELTVYNVLGEKIKTLVNDSQLFGRHEVIFSGHKLPSGIYYCRIKCSKFQTVKKMILMR